tara:strand:- start:2069 stop:2305 length:237 start_codon:yes stop_codon:yes gene_type:complete
MNHKLFTKLRLCGNKIKKHNYIGGKLKMDKSYEEFRTFVKRFGIDVALNMLSNLPKEQVTEELVDIVLLPKKRDKWSS